ncbi:MAG: hypothetical protein WC756_18905 [Taibaiella sp.]|jgi:hypothetical protein
MKFKKTSGLLALQLAAALTVSAQTYTFTIGNAESSVRVADHIGGEELDDPILETTLESYNLDHEGKKIVGLIRFNGTTGNLLFARHYWLSNSTDYIRALKGYEPFVQGAYVVAERVTDQGTVKSAVLLHYDQGDGTLVSAVELASLPSGYNFVRVFDVVEEFNAEYPTRILCTVDVEGDPRIIELLYSEVANQYKIIEYKAVNPPKEYKSVHYVHAYHYGRTSIGMPAFYGLADDGSTISAFCYYKDPNSTAQVFERYDLTSINGIKGITGVQMNGSYGVFGNHNRIEMAFTDEEGGICIQQEDELVTTNWQRFYQFPNKEKFLLGWGRDGHGTKKGPGDTGYGDSMGYFIGAWIPDNEPLKSQVTALHFDGLNGDLAKPRVYDYSGLGIYKDGSFPNTCYDPGKFTTNFIYNYTFIADRYEKRNGFHFGTGNSLVNTNEKFFCSKPIEIDKERDKRLHQTNEELYTNVFEPYSPHKIGLEEYPVDVTVTLDCPAEVITGGKMGKNELMENNSELSMDARHISIGANGKTIASVRVLTIDGRTITDVQGVNSANYEHQFAATLVPGIYVIHITYSDHSLEAKKVSIR